MKVYTCTLDGVSERVIVRQVISVDGNATRYQIQRYNGYGVVGEILEVDLGNLTSESEVPDMGA